jgi:aquaporin Z
MGTLHWREMLIEACGLGVFMVAAGAIATLLFSPLSALQVWLPEEWARNLLMGIAMGLTAIAIIYSPWGKRSGAHLNPAITLAFFRLGKLTRIDALSYVLAQFIGGTLGVGLVAALIGAPFRDAPPAGLRCIVTAPGRWGWMGAIAAEAIMALLLMAMVLVLSNSRRFAPFTGVFAGALVALFIAVASPISGMSINPARSFASAFHAGSWSFFWIYFFVPPLAMLLAVEVYLAFTRADPRRLCGKLCPNADTPCLCTRPCPMCCNAPERP